MTPKPGIDSITFKTSTGKSLTFNAHAANFHVAGGVDAMALLAPSTPAQVDALKTEDEIAEIRTAVIGSFKTGTALHWKHVPLTSTGGLTQLQVGVVDGKYADFNVSTVEALLTGATSLTPVTLLTPNTTAYADALKEDERAIAEKLLAAHFPAGVIICWKRL